MTQATHVKIAAEVKNFKPELVMSGKEIRVAIVPALNAAAGKEAMDLPVFSHGCNRSRIGVFIGSAVGGVSSFHKEVLSLEHPEIYARSRRLRSRCSWEMVAVHISVLIWHNSPSMC